MSQSVDGFRAVAERLFRILPPTMNVSPSYPHFKEYSEVIEAIQILCGNAPFGGKRLSDSLDKAADRQQDVVDVVQRLDQEDKMCRYVTETLKLYLEQPRLLDPHMHTMITPLLHKLVECLKIWEQSSITEGDSGFQKLDVNETWPSLRIFQNLKITSSILYTLCIVRHPKIACAAFLTDVMYLDIILSAAERLSATVPPPGSGDDQASCSTEFVWPNYNLLTSEHLKLDPRPTADYGNTACTPVPMRFIDLVQGEASIWDRVACVAQQSLRMASGGIQEAAVLLLTKLLSRPDAHATPYPRQLLVVAATTVSSSNLGSGVACNTKNESIGLTRAVTRLFKMGCRDVLLEPLLPYLSDFYFRVLPFARTFGYGLSAPSLLLKYETAGIGHCLLLYLPPHPGTWRYTQRPKALFSENNAVEEERECLHVQSRFSSFNSDDKETLELGIDILLERLAHENAAIRWTAAKALSRVVERLDVGGAEDIVNAVLKLLDVSHSGETRASEGSQLMKNEPGCIGACLSLAQFIRHGTLLPNWLPRLMPSLFHAVTYEPRTTYKGQQNYAAAIRDAACFVCWALARAFPPSILKPYVPSLTASLVPVALFDSDVNCRRAAAASIQEHVGRQGIFPHGIPLVTLADYYSLATLRNSFISVSPNIVVFPEYTDSILSALIDVKLRRSTRFVRELAARALQLAFSRIDSQTRVSRCLACLEKLQTRAEATPIAEERHGALLGIANCIEALGRFSLPIANSEPDSENQAVNLALTAVRNLVPRIEKNRLYRGRGGELTREACCRLLGALASTPVVAFRDKTASRYFQTLYECLRHFVLHVQLAAVEALYLLTLERASDAEVKDWTQRIMAALKNPTEHVAARRGLMLSVVALTSRASRSDLLHFVSFLCDSAVTRCPNGQRDLSDVEARQAALVSLSFVLKALQQRFEQNGCESLVHEDAGPSFTSDAMPILTTLVTTLKRASLDYDTDTRGDVGSWVRDAAIEVIAYLWEQWSNSKALSEQQSFSGTVGACSGGLTPSSFLEAFGADSMEELLHCILRQAVDKSDRTQARAAYLLYRIHITTEWQKENLTTKDSLLPPLCPEAFFRRIYYGYCYEIVPEAQAARAHAYAATCFAAQFTATRSNDPPSLFLTLCSLVLSTELGVCSPTGTQKAPGLGVQSALAVPWSVQTTDFDTPSLSDAEPTLDDNLQDLHLAETSEGVHNNALGLFTAWDPYNFVTQRFQKSGMAIRLPAFSSSVAIYNTFIPLLRHSEYRLPLLEGLTHSLGLTLNLSAQKSFSSLARLLHGNQQATQDAPTHTTLCGWISHTLVQAVLEKQQAKQTVTEDRKNDAPTGNTVTSPLASCSSRFSGVPLSCLYRTISLLLPLQLLEASAVQRIVPTAIATLMRAKDFPTLKATIDLLSSFAVCQYNDPAGSPQQMRWISLVNVIYSLGHRYPLIRQYASERLYAQLTLLTDDDLPLLYAKTFARPLEDVTTLILDTPWRNLPDAHFNDYPSTPVFSNSIAFNPSPFETVNKLLDVVGAKTNTL